MKILLIFSFEPKITEFKDDKIKFFLLKLVKQLQQIYLAINLAFK